MLRYLARIEADVDTGPRLIVGPVAVPANHPAATRRGSEAFVGFVTARDRCYPLIVRGPGAGGDVTAAGVLADCLRVAASVRGVR